MESRSRYNYYVTDSGCRPGGTELTRKGCLPIRHTGRSVLFFPSPPPPPPFFFSFFFFFFSVPRPWTVHRRWIILSYACAMTCDVRPWPRHCCVFLALSSMCVNDTGTVIVIATFLLFIHFWIDFVKLFILIKRLKLYSIFMYLVQWLSVKGRRLNFLFKD